MTSPQPGWYADPQNAANVRYWDGSQWTDQVQPAQQAAPAPQPTPQPVQAQGSIETELLTDPKFAETSDDAPVVKQNSRLLKVKLGPEFYAKQGSMVAYQGQVDFAYQGGGVGKFVKRAMTGEGQSLMKCSGQGEVFLADRAHQVHILNITNSSITVNGKNVLAFSPSLNWDVNRIKGGAAGMVAGGLFNTVFTGSGWLAITTDGDPVVLQTDAPTFADADAAVAWSTSLQTSFNSSFKAGALIGRGSGEAMQVGFQGQGIVIVQPSEGPVYSPAAAR